MVMIVIRRAFTAVASIVVGAGIISRAIADDGTADRTISPAVISRTVADDGTIDRTISPAIISEATVSVS
jgi:hypothetical protein